MKILLLRFSSLGDIVMTTAMIRSLRKTYPQAQIDMAVREDFKDLIEFNPHLNQKFYFSRKEGLGALISFAAEIDGKYDVIYDAHRSLRTRYLMPKVRAVQKLYFDKHYLKRSLALTFKLPLLENKRFLEKFVEPLEPLGVKYDGLGPEVFVPPDVEERMVGQYLDKKERRYIGLVPSAQWPGKRWPPERFAGVAKSLLPHHPHQFLIFGGKDDIFCSEIEKALPAHRVQNLQGKLSILECAALLKNCDLVIANDTGLLHVADAVNVPTVAILGPTSGELGCLPFHPLSQIAEKELWCRPCSKNGQAPCIRFTRHCLNDLTVEQVGRLAENILKEVKA